MVNASDWPGVCPRPVMYMRVFLSFLCARPGMWVAVQFHIGPKTALPVYQYERRQYICYTYFNVLHSSI